MMWARYCKRARLTIFMGLSMWLALAARAGGNDGSGSIAEGASGISDHGFTPNTTITSVAGIEVNQKSMDLMFSLPVAPEFKVGGGIGYSVSTRYDSNLVSYLSSTPDPETTACSAGYIVPSCTYSAKTGGAYIPTYKSPFGVGFEFGFGVVYKALNGAGQLDSRLYGWQYRSPDGSTHPLHLVKTFAPFTTTQQCNALACWNEYTFHDPIVATGESNVAHHFFGDTVGLQSGAVFVEHSNPAWEFATSDGSIIRARASYGADGKVNRWDLWFPDGRHAIFDHPYGNPDAGYLDAGASIQRRNAPPVCPPPANQPVEVCRPNVESYDPQEMIGFYPTRVENRSRVGFNLAYDATYGYLVNAIHDDTDRTGFVSMTVGTSGASAGRYTAISYPGPNGTPLTVGFTYDQTSLTLRGVGGNVLNFNGPLDTAHPAAPVTITRLRSVTLPGGFVENFEYYDEATASGTSLCGDGTPVSDDNPLASGKIARILTPNGAVHRFVYKQFPNHVLTDSNPGSDKYPNDPHVGICAHHLDARDPGPAPQQLSGADHQRWLYRQEDVYIGSTFPHNWEIKHYDTRNIVDDPGNNSSTYYFYGSALGGGGRAKGLLGGTDYYEGQFGSGGVLKKSVLNSWGNTAFLPEPDQRAGSQIVKTVTQLFDDVVNGQPGTIVEENLNWDGWGHFTTHRTSGTLTPKARQTITHYSADKSKIQFDVFREPGGDVRGYYETTWSNSLDPSNPSIGVPIYFPFYSAHPSSPNCAYLNSLLGSTPDANGNLPWFPSLPLAVETQEQTGTDSLGNPIFTTRAVSESRYDAATGLPVRTIARKDPTAPISDECAASLSTSAGDIVSDFYYDVRGNLALTKTSGGDDNSVFRKFSGTGDAPAAAAPPTTPAAVGPDASEPVYPSTGAYYGMARWSRGYTGDATHGGEGVEHQFLDGVVNSADIEPTSGAVHKGFDGNGLATLHEYDSVGRIKCNRFLGSDGGLTSCTQLSAIADQPVEYGYLTVSGGKAGTRMVGLQTLRDDPADATQLTLTQDYFDGLGRKVVTRRRNPDGQFSYQVQHYDVMGHVDLVSNWSFQIPPGVVAQECTVDQLRAQNTPCPAVDPSQWTDGALRDYITRTVGSYTKSCYRAACDDTAPYDFAGRVRRLERWNGTTLLSAVDTEYFGLNVKTTVHGVKTGATTTEDRVSVHYKDGYGNLRLVDEDVRPDGSAGQGVDAIYDYDWGNRLVKVNLVPQIHIAPFTSGGDRYATSDADNQLRTFKFDTLGRQIEANNPETGRTLTLSFNALGAPLETEDENGRLGGGPGGGNFSSLPAPRPAGGCLLVEPGNPGAGYICPAPNLQPRGLAVRSGALSAQWTATGLQRDPGIGTRAVTVPASGLYYRVTLDGAMVVDWSAGLLTWHTEGLAPGGHTLTVEATYVDNLAAQDPGLVATLTQNFSESVNAAAYHLLRYYDARGRATATVKRTLSTGGLSVLRDTRYEGKPGVDCSASRSCGQAVETVAYQPLGVARESFAFDLASGRPLTQQTTAPALSGDRSDLVQFTYDRFGRQKEAVYPDGRRIALEYQFGGVRSVGSLSASGGGTYASLWRHGDYHADGSLATYLQGNGVAFHRQIDGAERTQQICYDTIPTNPPYLALCSQTSELWDSGPFQYDFAGNIAAIGSDNFFYDRLSRLKEATVNRHPHDTFANGPQPAGSVTLDYAYDTFGNITDRQLTAMTNYTVGTNPLEIFGGRSYTLGVAPVTDNQIHAAGFLYDGNGNLVSDGVKDFIYDELNQQVEVRQVNTACIGGLTAGQPPGPNGNANFHANLAQIKNQLTSGPVPNVACYGTGNLVEKNGYDGGGMRVVRETYDPVTGSPKRTTYARLGGNVVKEYAQEYRTITSPTPEISHEKAYIYGPLGLLATEELCSFNCKSDESAGINVTRYYEYDHLGTVRAITNVGGALETTFDYEPFGLELKGAVAPWATDTSSNTHRFTGHERDDEAGEDYMKARMFVLSTARFPQIDPLFGGAENPQNWNPYIYVLNSPVGASDPTGMKDKNEKPVPTQHAPTYYPVLKMNDFGGYHLAFTTAPATYTPPRVPLAAQQLGKGIKDGATQALSGLVGDAKTAAALGPTGLVASKAASAAKAGYQLLTNPAEQRAVAQFALNPTSYQIGRMAGGALVGLGVAAATGGIEALAAPEIMAETTIEGGMAAAPADAAQTALGEELTAGARVPLSKRPAVLIGASGADGNAVVGRSSPGPSGCCAEVDAAAQLGGNPRNITFTLPVRPRTGEIIPVCENCQSIFGKDQFPKGTPFK